MITSVMVGRVTREVTGNVWTTGPRLGGGGSAAGVGRGGTGERQGRCGEVRKCGETD